MNLIGIFSDASDQTIRATCQRDVYHLLKIDAFHMKTLLLVLRVIQPA